MLHGAGIFTYIWVIFRANVGKYTIHGAFGWWFMKEHDLDPRSWSSWSVAFSRRCSDRRQIWQELWSRTQSHLEVTICYPLVICYITMENHRFYIMGKSTISTGPFSIAFFVCLPGRVRVILKRSDPVKCREWVPPPLDPPGTWSIFLAKEASTPCQVRQDTFAICF